MGVSDANRRAERSEADTVPRVTVNQIYASHARPHFPFIVKVDIEGVELDLFSGNTEWVARTPLLIVEPHNWLLPRDGTLRPFLQCITESQPRLAV